MFGFKLLGLALSAALTLTPGVLLDDPVSTPEPTSIPTPPGPVFPQTRHIEVVWSFSYNVQDIGISQNMNTASDLDRYESTKHQYNVEFEVTYSCNQVCSFAPPQYGYDLDGSFLTETYFEKFELTPDQMRAKLDQLDSTVRGSQNQIVDFENSFDYKTLDITLPLIDWSPVRRIYFPADTSGKEIRNLRIDFNYWRQLDTIHKAQELKYFIYQMSHNGNPMNAATQTQVDQLIESGDIDGAYVVVNNYYYAETQETNEKTESSIDDFGSHNDSLDSLTTQEQNFAGKIESDFTSQIGQISTENITQSSDFQHSAVWVTDKFNRFTQNNAFGSLLGFSLLIGFAMAIIGRVLK